MRRLRLGPGRKSLDRGSTFASRGNGLKRTSFKRRRRSPNHPGDLTGHSCFFHDVLGWPGACSARVDPCHLIPQERIVETFERRGEPCPDLWDQRLWVPGCRQHHHIFDRKFNRINLRDYPPTLLAWAQQHRFFWDELKGWIGETTPTMRAA